MEKVFYTSVFSVAFSLFQCILCHVPVLSISCEHRGRDPLCQQRAKQDLGLLAMKGTVGLTDLVLVLKNREFGG